MNVLLRLWPRLEKVHASLTDPEARHQSLLLARLLLVLILLCGMFVIIETTLVPGFRVYLLALVPALGLLVLAYALNHHGRYRTGGMIAVTVMLAGCFGALIILPQDALVYAYFAIPLFLARLFLPGVLFVTLPLVVIVGVLGVSWLQGSGYVQAVVGGLFLFVMTIFFGIARQHRTSIEHERRAALTASERELRTILDNMQDTYYRTDAEGQVVRASESTTKLLGYTPGEVLGMQMSDLFVESDGQERFLAALNAAGGTLRNYEAALRHRDGTVIWISTNAQFVRDTNGREIGIEGTSRDISERKLAEDRLLNIARGVSATTGETFFHSLVAHLVKSLHADYAFVGGLVPGATDRIHTLAVNAQGERSENFEYGLLGTPCHNVVGNETCSYLSAVQAQFPDDHMLQQMGVEAYVGTPLFGAKGEALGLMSVLYRHPVDQEGLIVSTLEIFAARAAAELQRLRTEQALRYSEIMLERAQEMTHLGSWTWEVDTGQITWSDEMYRIYGVSPDAGEVSFERAMAAIHPDDRAFVAQQVQNMLDGKDTENYEYRIVRPDGVERIVWARSEVQRAADGSPQLVIGTVQDITGRKRAEQALRDSEARLRAVVSNAPVVLYTLDREGIILLSEGRGLEALQLKPGEVVGRSVFEMYRDYPEICAEIRRALAGKKVVHFATLGPLTFEVHYSPTFGADGRVETVIGLAIDISERMQAETALVQSESNFRALTENSNVGILVNHRGKHVFANNRLLDMLGYTADEIRTTGVKELVHPQEYDKVMARFRETHGG